MIQEKQKISLDKLLNSIESGSRPKGGIVEGETGAFSLGGEHLDGEGCFNFSNQRYVSLEFYDNMKTGIVKPNDILVVKDGATTGKVAYVKSNFSYFPACINEHLFKLSVNEKIADSQYIFYYLLSSKGKKEILLDFRGATIGGISRDFVKNIKIPLPPLEEQKRIAKILSKCDRIRRTRQYSLQLSDTYLQSVFLEMFGDPVTNSMGWEVVKIDDISTKVTDGEHTTPKRTQTGIKLLSARNIQNGYIDFTTGLDFIPESEYQRIKKRCNPQKGDILMSCSGSIGRVTTVNIIEPFSLVRSVALIKLKQSKVIDKYIEFFLRSDYCQDVINKNAHQSSQANIFTGQIKDIPVLIPPLPLQEKFAKIVQKFDRFRNQQREAQRQSDHLFQTLLHQAFTGEL